MNKTSTPEHVHHVHGHKSVATLPFEKLRPAYCMRVTLLICGTFTIVFGAISVLAQAIGYGLRIYLYHVGAGIWSGVFFIVTGSFNVTLYSYARPCIAVTSMILSIACSAFAVTLLTLGILGLSGDIQGNFDRRNCYWGSKHKSACLALQALFLISSVSTMFLSIVAAVCSGKVFCCCSERALEQGHTVVYHRRGDKQLAGIYNHAVSATLPPGTVVMLPSGQQAVIPPNDIFESENFF